MSSYFQSDYTITPEPFPRVVIFCRHPEFISREEIVVLEDCTGWSLPAILHACDAAYIDWLAENGHPKLENEE